MIDADEYERKFLNNLSAVLQASCWLYHSLLPRHTGCLLKVTALPSWSVAMLSFPVSVASQGSQKPTPGRAVKPWLPAAFPFPFPFPFPGDIPSGSGTPRRGPDASSRLTATWPSPGPPFSVGPSRRLTKPSGWEPLYSLRLPWGPPVSTVLWWPQLRANRLVPASSLSMHSFIFRKEKNVCFWNQT